MAAALAACLFVTGAMMFDFQTSAIFPTHMVARSGPLPAGAERVQIDGPGGERLHGVHLRPSAPPKGPKTLILGFGGNAWNAEDAGSYLHRVFPAADVIAFHYRGYSPSTGSPSAEALVADAPLVHDFAVGRVKPERTVAVGFSIGSGIAAQLATVRKIDGMILVTPFDSLKAAAADLYPMLPVSLLFRHEMDSASAVRKSDVPVAIIAAGEDRLILPRRTDALRHAGGKLVFDRTIAGAGHNDIYERSEFHAAMRAALTAVTATARGGNRTSSAR